MKISGHTMGTPEYTVSEALELFARLGLDGAEIVVQDGYRSGIPSSLPIDEVESIARQAKRLGVEIIALTPYNSYFNDLDDGVRNNEIDALEKVINAARVLGAKYIRIYAGNYAQGDTDPNGLKRQRLIEAMREIGDKAKAAGVFLVMENHFNTMTVSASQTRSLAAEINHPAVGILYDQVNLTFTCNEDYREAIALQKEFIRFVHVKDMIFTSDDRSFVSSDVSRPAEDERKVRSKIVGEGTIPWPDILTELKTMGYDGWLSLEYERRWHPQDIPDASVGMYKSAKYLRECMSNM